MTATELLTKLQAEGISVSVDGADLVLKGKRSVLTAEVKEALREQKPQIIDLLSANPCSCPESRGAAGCGPDYPKCASPGKKMNKEQLALPFPMGYGGLDSVQVEIAERDNVKKGIVDPVNQRLAVIFSLADYYQKIGDLALAQKLKTAYQELRSQATDVVVLVKLGDSDEATLLTGLRKGQQWLTEFNDELEPDDKEGAAKLQNSLDRWVAMEEQLRLRHGFTGCIRSDDQQYPVAALVSCEHCKTESAIGLIGTEELQGSGRS